MLHFLNDNRDDLVKQSRYQLKETIVLTIGALPYNYKSYVMKENDEIIVINTKTDRSFSFAFSEDWCRLAHDIFYTNKPKKEIIAYLKEALSSHLNEELLLEKRQLPPNSARALELKAKIAARMEAEKAQKDAAEAAAGTSSSTAASTAAAASAPPAPLLPSKSINKNDKKKEGEPSSSAQPDSSDEGKKPYWEKF